MSPRTLAVTGKAGADHCKGVADTFVGSLNTSPTATELFICRRVPWNCLGCPFAPTCRARHSTVHPTSPLGPARSVMVVYDLVIVGRGMVGSAAARHAAQSLSQEQGPNPLRVALVGPDEPPRDTFSELEVFGAHYDEGRITRKTDPDPTWAWLAQRSIERFARLEEPEGPPFFVECGHLAVAPAESPNLQQRAANARAQGVAIQELGPEELAAQYPYLALPPGARGVYEADGAG